MNKHNLPVCDYEGSDYQQSFWDSGERVYEDAVEAIALRRLLPPRGEFMLELGAGAGRNTSRYEMFNRVALLDYSRSQLEQARDRLGASERYLYVAADVYHLPFVDGIFDGATMIRTLHHMMDPQLALLQVRQVMSLGGIFVLEFANKQNLKAMLRYLLGKQDWSPFSKDPVEFANLNYDFHPKTIRCHLRTARFEVEKQLTVSHFRVNFLKRHIPVGVLVRMDALLQWTGRLIQISPSVFSRCRAAGKAHGSGEGLFKCPACGNPLQGLKKDLNCDSCGAVWVYREGIYDFRMPGG